MRCVCGWVRYYRRMSKAPKRTAKRGRPPGPEEPMKQIALRLPAEMLDALDAIVAERLDRPDRTAVIRELLAEGLEAREKGKGRR